MAGNDVWQKIKDGLLIVLGILLLPVLVLLAVPGALAGFARWLVRNQRGGTGSTGGDHDDTGDDLEATSEAISSSSEAVDRSRSDNEQSLSLNRQAQDIIERIRERKQTQDGS